MPLAATLREAIQKDGRSHYAIAKEAAIQPDILDRFVRGERDMRLATAEKVAAVLQLELCSVSPSKGQRARRTRPAKGASGKGVTLTVDPTVRPDWPGNDASGKGITLTKYDLVNGGVAAIAKWIHQGCNPLKTPLRHDQLALAVAMAMESVRAGRDPVALFLDKARRLAESGQPDVNGDDYDRAKRNVRHWKDQMNRQLTRPDGPRVPSDLKDAMRQF